MRHRVTPILFAFAVFISWIPVSAALAVEVPTRLFEPEFHAVAHPPGPATRSAHTVTVASAPVVAGTPRLRIDLPSGASHLFDRSDFVRRGALSATWRGRGMIDSESVTLTIEQGVIVGRLETRDGNFELTTATTGQTLLLELDEARFPACGQPLEATGRLRPPPEMPAALLGGGPTTTIDVMVMYTPSARVAAGGTAAITATAQGAIDVANTAFIDSNMRARFVLVHSAETSFDDSGSSSTDLSTLSSNNEVSALRNEYGADLVGLLADDGGGFCGRGFVMRDPGPGFSESAFQVTSRNCAIGNLSYAHEHGHNMGFEHDPANGTSPGNASFLWSFGHFNNGLYRTVMSYSNQCVGGCSRVAHFSNPDVDHQLLPTGIADQRDNARSGNATAEIVAAFRARGVVFGDGFESGGITAWSGVTP